ncbi:MAG: succinyl-CoA synthetase subunit beta [Rhodobacteraceae bacterium]|nr:succinyl-CoA synthetase subunit beta [Paracoccaceae bacterium]
MLLPEHRSKELLAKYGVPIPPGFLARTANDAETGCGKLDASRYVVKSQILAGGRGLAGGVRIVDTPSAVGEEVGRLLGHTLVTEQTGPRGEVVSTVYIETALDIVDSRFMALALDPESGAVMLLASAAGGVEFEQRARMDDSVYDTMLIDSDTPETRKSVTAFLKKAGIDEAAVDIAFAGYAALIENELTLVEINPLAKTRTGDWYAADAKVALDGNALFRHPEFEEFKALQNPDPIEAAAQQNNINLVKLEGNIGVVVNGAGLGLATHDMLTEANGKPANFMDIRTTATSLNIAKGVELLLQDPKVRCILLNIHGGGITLGDTVAEGVSIAYGHSSRKVPLVARMAGQNADRGLAILKEHRLPVEVVGTMSDAIARSVALAG